MTEQELLGYLRDAAQGASNSAASTVSAPVDLLAWLLRKGGVPVGDAPVMGSDWMAQRGFTAQPKNALAGLAGETVGNILPIAAAAKAPQIANALIRGQDAAGRGAVALGQKGADMAGDYMARQGMIQPATVWHGSPHKFDKFDAAHIGKGEGAQAYGHGLYLADHPETAMSYQPRDPKFEQRIMSAYKQAEARGQYPAMEVHEAYLLHKTPAEVQAMIDGMEGVSAADKAAAMQAHKFAQQQYAKQTAGSLYKVDLPDSAIARMLDWDKPLSQQAPEVQAALGSSFKPTDKGEDIVRYGLPQFAAREREMYQRMLDDAIKNDPYPPKIADLRLKLADLSSPDGAAAAQLRKAGIPGIRYLDAGSRGAGAGTSNYVVFPGEENMLRILERNGVPIGK